VASGGRLVRGRSSRSNYRESGDGDMWGCFPHQKILLFDDVCKQSRIAKTPLHNLPLVLRHLDAWIAVANSAHFVRVGQTLLR
jgi:hypothetical protein